MSDTVEVVDIHYCPVCGGEWSGERVTGNNVNFDGNPAYWYVCSICGALALSPRMTDEFTETYYQGSYRDKRPYTEITHLVGSNRAAVQVKLAGDYLRGETALDIGCSMGYLMEKLYYMGFIVTGIDPDPESVADYPRWQDAPDKAYDLICMSHTLEHVNHPRQFLSGLLAKFAKPGTRLMIDVPNYPDCKGAMMFQFHHPLCYSLESLTWLLECIGCRVIFSATHNDGRNIDERNNLLVVAEVQ